MRRRYGFHGIVNLRAPVLEAKIRVGDEVGLRSAEAGLLHAGEAIVFVVPLVQADAPE